MNIDELQKKIIKSKIYKDALHSNYKVHNGISSVPLGVSPWDTHIIS